MKIYNQASSTTGYELLTCNNVELELATSLVEKESTESDKKYQTETENANSEKKK